VPVRKSGNRAACAADFLIRAYSIEKFAAAGPE